MVDHSTLHSISRLLPEDGTGSDSKGLKGKLQEKPSSFSIIIRRTAVCKKQCRGGAPHIKKVRLSTTQANILVIYVDQFFSAIYVGYVGLGQH